MLLSIGALSSVGKVSRSDLRDLLLQCCADEAPDVRQSALALLGDLVKVLISSLMIYSLSYSEICIVMTGMYVYKLVSSAN